MLEYIRWQRRDVQQMHIITEPISQIIWDLKYRYRQGGSVIDQSVEDTWRRVAKAIAKAEKGSERKGWEKKFYHLLEAYRFLPGGRILAGAGTAHHVTLFNCFVMNIAEDSLRGIFGALEEGALTLQQGGGVGYDFSVLRPKGALVEKTGLSSSGPVSFMQIWDATCGILLSTGVRRGAMMGVMRCDHPDIFEFIAAKRDPHLLRHFNVSVLVSDQFIAAVKANADWPLVFQGKIYRKVKARELWEEIIRAAYDYAEPGVLFGDTINNMNNLYYREKIQATNPCGEIPLPAYGACDLGAINLTQFVVSAFSEQAKLNWSGIEEAVSVATRFLDNVIDVSRYPLKVQHQQAHGTRRIGLGITGLADVFVMLGIQYGSEESISLAREIMKRISDVTWRVSIDFAREKGAFPFYDPAYLQGQFVQSLDADIQRQLMQQGVRNSHHNTIAPTGTTSLFANNVSNGIEPIFRAEYSRHVRGLDKEMQTFQVKDYAYHVWLHEKREGLPLAWVDVNALQPDAHLSVQAAMQPYVDNAISKTINIPRDFPFEKLVDVYTRAHELGLKGCTIFRPNAITGAVLEEQASATQSVDQCCQHD
jgi:ribonucleoside-diphosphate reductase alpha chain